MGKTDRPQFGQEFGGAPVSIGGERIDRNNYVTKDRYLKERAILENYDKIKTLNNELADLNHAIKEGGSRTRLK